MNDFYKKLVKKTSSYPSVKDTNLQYNLYKKREYIIHKVPKRILLEDVKKIREYQKKVCSDKITLYTQQALLSNFLNPNTPYRAICLKWGTGTGKTCGAFAIAERFIEQVKKYDTKIYILVSGPFIKENWENEFYICFGDKYKTKLVDESFKDEKTLKNSVLSVAKNYYTFLSYRSFYKKVLGDKILEKRKVGDKFMFRYKKTTTGDYERELSINNIDRLDNTLLIVDEAHNLTGNDTGLALKKIIKKSKNLKLLLLTATPMKNMASNIIEIINFMRPPNDPIIKDKVFNNPRYNHELKIKPGGIEYLKKMASGYFSVYRGQDPLTFATKVDVGEIPKELLFTKVIQCPMKEFQYNTYKKVIANIQDSLDRTSSAISNFSIPILSEDKKLIGGYSKNGIDRARDQISNNKELLCKTINKKIFGGKIKKWEEIIDHSEKNDNITGLILKMPYLQNFSSKFYQVMLDLKTLFSIDKKSEYLGTGFVYCNLVKVGIEVFQEVLKKNGFIEYRADGNYVIEDNTRCYHCYQEKKNHKESATHKFHPVTFIVFTGSSEEGIEILPEEKRLLLDTFNSIENKHGKHIKLLLGSSVMSEGITLKNVRAGYVLDVYFNLNRLEQIVGRIFRSCKHYQISTDKNPFPTAKIFKYVASIPGEDKPSAEIELYKKAERKYILVKKIERILKEVSIDCPLNYNANIFPEEKALYKNCTPVQNIIDKNLSNKSLGKLCPEKCEFENCLYVCNNKKLNLAYYDKNLKYYRDLKKKEIDNSTFSISLAQNEIENIKESIKEMYVFKYVYKLRNILNYVKKKFTGNRELFNEYFVYKALDELIPTSENDFNNFKDIIYDKYNVGGYLIYRRNFYIFQPFNEEENISMHYRKKFNKKLLNQLNTKNYIDLRKIKSTIILKGTETKKIKYDYLSIQKYYDGRKENDIVGIIAKKNEIEIFKIRNKRDKILKKKRETGLSSSMGAVCFSSNSKGKLNKIFENIKSKMNKNFEEILKEYSKDIKKKMSEKKKLCQLTKFSLLLMEKYNNEKTTYMIIPKNHPKYRFPYNLKDYVKSFVEIVENSIPGIKLETEKINGGIFLNISNKKLVKYKITTKNKINSDLISKSKKKLNKMGFVLENNKFTKTIE